MTWTHNPQLVKVICLALALTTVPAGRMPAQEQPGVPTLRSDTLEVLVDVVVRDKRGRIVRGLKPSDLVMKEDGVTQTITSFREVNLGPAAAAKPPEPAETGARPAVVRESVQISKQIRLVSLIYDRLGPDGRRLSRQASLEFLKKDLGTNVYYGVFTIDRGFQVVQQYTNDTARLKSAIERATSGERSSFGSSEPERQSTQGAAAAVSAAAATGNPGAVDGAALSAEQSGRMAKEMSDMAEMLSREDVGRMSVFSLWAIIKELQKLPGRKTALYFAEGLQMPTGLVEQFKAMLSDANRGNVSVYAIDARGLITASDQAFANQKLSEAARWSQYARNTQTESAEGNKQEFRTFDRALDSIRGNQQQVMVELAESTGGFLIANTNDFRPGLEKLSEEFNTYYEITYRPANQLPDGRFREISVKPAKQDLQVQARDGYFALPPMEGQTVFPYEVPLLKALSKTPPPQDLEFRSRLLQFHREAGLSLSVLVFDLPMKGVAFFKDDKVGKYRTHITVLSLLKDETGRVVGKLSRDVPLNEPLEKLGGFSQGRFIATRLVHLQPGRYTLESVAADFEGNRTGVRRSVVVVPARPPGPEVSEISLVRRIDKLPDPRDIRDPFQITVGRVIPTLIDTVAGGPGHMLSVFLSLFPDASNQEKPKLILDLMQDDKLMARSVPELPPAELSGAIPFIANTPLDSVKPGQYQLRATLVQGQAAAQKSIYVNVE